MIVDRRVRPAPVATESPAPFTGWEWLFILGAAIAPVDLLIIGSFTVYDFIIAALFFGGLLTRRPLHLPRFMAVPAMVFLGAATISTVRSPKPLESIEQILQFAFIFFVLVPVTLMVVRSPRVLHGTLIAFAIGSLAGAMVSIVLGQDAGAGRIMTFFSDNPNRLGYPSAYLAPFVVFYIWRAWKHGRVPLAVLGGGGAAYVFAWALAASASRSAALGLLVALVVMIARPPFDLKRVAVASMVAIVAVGSLALAISKTDLFPDKLAQRFERTVGGEEDLVSDRSRLARAGLRAFADSPLVGTGFDNFRFVATDFVAAATDQLPHNLWIQLLAQIGLIGAAAFAVLLGRWFLALFRVYRGSMRTREGPLEWAFIASMASVLTIFMFVPLMIHRHYWLLFGLGVALVRLQSTRSTRSVRLPS